MKCKLILSFVKRNRELIDYASDLLTPFVERMLGQQDPCRRERETR